MKMLTLKKFSYSSFKNRSKIDHCRCWNEYIAIKILRYLWWKWKMTFSFVSPKQLALKALNIWIWNGDVLMLKLQLFYVLGMVRNLSLRLFIGISNIGLQSLLRIKWFLDIRNPTLKQGLWRPVHMKSSTPSKAELSQFNLKCDRDNDYSDMSEN